MTMAEALVRVAEIASNMLFNVLLCAVICWGGWSIRCIIEKRDLLGRK